MSKSAMRAENARSDQREELLALLEQFHEDTGLGILPMSVLAVWCQRLGLSGRGTRAELTARLLKAIRKR
jgi:hypothetical protein